MASHGLERRVVITGIGTVTALGHDIESFWQAIIAGQCGIDRIASFDPANYDCKIAAEVKGFDPVPAFPSPKEVRRTDRFAQLGIYAGWRALQDSGMDLDKLDRDQIGAFIGSGIGGIQTHAEQHSVLQIGRAHV